MLFVPNSSRQNRESNRWKSKTCRRTLIVKDGEEKGDFKTRLLLVKLIRCSNKKESLCKIGRIKEFHKDQIQKYNNNL